MNVRLYQDWPFAAPQRISLTLRPTDNLEEQLKPDKPTFVGWTLPAAGDPKHTVQLRALQNLGTPKPDSLMFVKFRTAIADVAPTRTVIGNS